MVADPHRISIRPGPVDDSGTRRKVTDLPTCERIRSQAEYSDRVLTGATLRELRTKAGLTQAEVGRRVGIPATVVSAYECGRRQPSLEVAGRIIEAMGFEARFVRVLDPEVQGRKLVEVLTLAEALPYRPRPLAKARQT